MSGTRSLIQGAELWIPTGEWLTLRSGAYGPHTEFARVSARSRFRRGEGLPGAVWATQQALVWHDLRTHFVRAEHAAAAGIDAAVGFPWFHGRELEGVLTLLLTASATSPGCVEVWNHDDTLDVLRHGGGLYADTKDFEGLSKLLQFPYAAGLPGLTWSRGIPTILDDVGASSEFVRAESARRAGLKRAIGVPFYRDRRVAHVLALIGSGTQCFVRACQLFGHGEHGLVSRACFTEPPGVDENALAREALARDVWLSPRLPLVTPAPHDGLETSTGARSEILLTLPIHDGIRLRGVACFEF
ncbi:MAG TPA: GAF domain-containing protein [Polyangiaceae bacterium]|nr:GAF domain-containing protein [Polyangiaceae bacterium]